MNNKKTKWTITGIIVSAVIIITILLLKIFFFDSNYIGKQIINKTAENFYTILEENKQQQIKCPVSADGLASCITKKLIQNRYNNIINYENSILATFTSDEIPAYFHLKQMYYSIISTFTSNEICQNENDCKIDFIVNDKVCNKKYTTMATILLYIDNDGYIRVKNKKPENYKFKKISEDYQNLP